MGITDRVIVLIDMDCFYCQVEEKLDPKLDGKPIAVVQYNAWRGGGIIAVNYPARDQGVTRHMRGNEAKKKCPRIKLVQVPEVRGKADLTKYRDAGKRVADVLATFTPLLERASVDEAYLDITEQVAQRIKTNFNDLTPANLPNTFVVGHDTQDFIHNVTTNREFAESDLKLAFGALITEEIRRAVYEKTGYKCSAGIAHNKILAKLVCSLHKPNKQTVLPQEAVHDFFTTMPINKIKSLGGKFGQSLTEDLNIKFMGELRNFSKADLSRRYDEKTATWLHNIARGIDLDPVTTKLISKSIACCKNFPGKSALITPADVEHWLHKLAEELSERLTKDHKENNRKAKQMVVSFTQKIHHKEVSSTRTHPLISYETIKIVRGAFEVLKKFCVKSDDNYHLTFLGLSAGHFEDIKGVREITSFFKAETSNGRKSGDKTNGSGSSYFKSLDNSDTDLFVTENLEFMDCDELENSPYLQLTQELDENLQNFVFLDDSYRVKQDSSLLGAKLKRNSFLTDNSNNIEVQQLDKASSFFKGYFISDPQKATTSKVTEDEFKTETDEEFESFNGTDETKQICAECNKSILKSDMLSHQDYHFALSLVESEKNSGKLEYNTQQHNTPTPIKKTRRKTIKINKKKVLNNSKSVTSFFKTKTAVDTLEFTETCSECGKKLRKEDVNSHIDYHVAKKIHLEINSSLTPVSSAGNKCRNSGSKSIASFFSHTNTQ